MLLGPNGFLSARIPTSTSGHLYMLIVRRVVSFYVQSIGVKVNIRELGSS